MARRSALGRRARSTATAVAVTLLLAVGGWPAARAQTPQPASDSQLAMTSRLLLGGVVERGGWAAARVTLQNDGPTVHGELQVQAGGATSSTYGLSVELATGSRQEHVLYAPVGAIGSRLTVKLVSGSAVLAGEELTFTPSAQLDVAIVAERPEQLVGPIREALATRLGAAAGGGAPSFTGLAPVDLPARAEAWSAIDVLVLHDVEAASLDAGQLEALRAWTLAGGEVLLTAGSLGPAAFAGYPPELLAFQPRDTVDIPLSELTALLGDLPSAAAPLPALGGEIERGTALVSSADRVVAGRVRYGAGSSTLVGLNPATSWLVGPTADAFWTLFLPPDIAAQDPRLPAEDEFFVNALGALPALQLPRSDHLLLLVLGYIITIGPINYLVLKRRDRREWAWLTMPLTIAFFAVAGYGLGVVARGASVVVNELVIVHGAAGADRGIADARVGVFSPGRAEFDVRVGGGALVSTPTGATGNDSLRAMDVLLGDPATVRRYGVGFGALRAFRAQAVVSAPLVHAELAFDGEMVRGTVTNASAVTLSDVAVVFSLGAQMLGDMAPGESREVRVRAAAEAFQEPTSSQLYPYFSDERESSSRIATRRALIAHLGGGWEEGWSGAGILGGRPVVLAWLPGGLLPVDVGVPADQVGETLYVLTARTAATGPVSFAGSSIARTAMSIDAADGFAEGPGFFLSRGTITVGYRPFEVDGTFSASTLLLRLDLMESPRTAGRTGTDLAPLPASEQPPGDDPLSADPRPNDGDPNAPRVQLFDRVAGTWVEFEPVELEETYRITDAARYVDSAGAFRVRFVARHNEFMSFSFNARLEGTIE